MNKNAKRTALEKEKKRLVQMLSLPTVKNDKQEITQINNMIIKIDKEINKTYGG